LQVTVPTGATSGPLTLNVPGGKDVSSNSFTVTSNSTVNLSKTVSPVIAGPGTNVTYTLLVTNKGAVHRHVCHCDGQYSGRIHTHVIIEQRWDDGLYE